MQKVQKLLSTSAGLISSITSVFLFWEEAFTTIMIMAILSYIFAWVITFTLTKVIISLYHWLIFSIGFVFILLLILWIAL